MRRAAAVPPGGAHVGRGASLARAAVGTPVAGVRSLLFLFALLAAFLGQDIVTQSHIHPLGQGSLFETAAQSGVGTGGSATQKRHPGKAPADCPICRELAMAGHFIAPGPLVLALQPAAAAWLFLSPVAILAVGTRSHGWRSRAPPL